MNPSPVEAVAPGSSGADAEARVRRELRDVARDFEALFLQSLLARMRQAQLESGFFGGGAGSSVYEGMFEQFMSDELAETSPLGIARMLEEQWEDRAKGVVAIRDALGRIRAEEGLGVYESIASGDFPGFAGESGSPTQVPGAGADPFK